MGKFYVTTPIYYANAEPHIGSAYATLSADIIARYYRQKLGNENVLSLVGTDEHGQKIAEEAETKGKDPKEYVDSLVPTFKEAWEKLNIDYDIFMRTTDSNHEKEVIKILQKIYDKGYIYPGVYEGLYCVGCEKFLTEKDLVDGRCPLHPNKIPAFQKENNYFFKLSGFQDLLIKLFESNEVEILPEHRKKEILNRIKDGLQDISISREEVSWGIPIPWDKKHTIYVWVEALFNYYTATRKEEKFNKFWPADLHIVGKDILWFHTTIWCALLLAAELELPKVVFGHGFLILGGQKISKSLGNVISPRDLISRYGVDATRYLLATAANFGDDRDIKEGEFDEKYNADLANGLGNLVARVSTLAVNSGLKFKVEDITDDLKELYRGAQHDAFLEYRFDEVLKNIWLLDINPLDIHLNQNSPWLEKDTNRLHEVLQYEITQLRTIGKKLLPFLPETAMEIENRFGGEQVIKGGALFMRLS